MSSIKVVGEFKARNIRLLICLLLTLVILIVYKQIIGFDFIGFDDELYITENKIVQKGFTVEGVKWAFKTFYASNWHPLTWLSHMLDCEIYGMNPSGHHLTNLQLHIANTLLLFFILNYMTGMRWRSVLVAALFAIHPLHVESVAWVAERKDVLSTFFGFLAIGTYCRYVNKTNLIYYFLTFLFLGLGLMAKPMLVTLPFVLLLLDLWPLKRIQYENLDPHSRIISISGFQIPYFVILEKIPLFLLVITSSMVTIVAQQSQGAVESFEALSAVSRISNAFVSYIKYIVKMLWPDQMAIFYPHPVNSLPLWQVMLSVLLILIGTLWAIRAVKKRPYITVGWFWYIGTLIPVIGLIQVGQQALADRYTYIPLIGLFIIVAWGVPDLLGKMRYRKSIV
ncbi:MAG: glycosyltransferase family 39 protein, partial [Deltaproteobacteria bacterium]|nr:glycosyltransferase family 39 protein [Deltaproteobacteria bacterium]